MRCGRKPIFEVHRSSYVDVYLLIRFAKIEIKPKDLEGTLDVSVVDDAVGFRKLFHHLLGERWNRFDIAGVELVKVKSTNLLRPSSALDFVRPNRISRIYPV